jgi:P4 family phage/plasmid primase-like protien
LGIYGGSYSIPDAEYPEFLERYKNDVLLPGESEYLTELQLDTGAILVDLDFRFDYSTETRHYTKDHIDDLVGAYTEEIIRMYQLDADSTYEIFVLEKNDVNRVREKNITKDGIHLVITIAAERRAQIALRNRMVPRLAEMWKADIPITNSWEEVLDEGIAKGVIGWQLYGSTKPGYEPYKLTHIYTVKYDETDSQPMIDCVSTESPEWNPDWNILLPKLSARCRTHPQFLYRTAFLKEVEKIQIKARHLAPPSSSSGLGDLALLEYDDVLRVRNATDLDDLVAQFLEKHKTDKWDIVEAFWYAMSLPSSYYDAGSYTKWTKVAMALKNTNPSSFVLWVAFSARSPTFDWMNIHGLLDKWNSFGIRSEDCITSRSIAYWCKDDAPDEYRAIKLRCAEATMERIMGGYEDIDEDAKVDRRGTTDYDLAKVLHVLKGNEYKCVSITNNIWYRYEEPRWKKIDAGVDLRKSISTELRALYSKKSREYSDMRDNLPEDEDPRKVKKITKYYEKMQAVSARLGSTNDKKNIMKEAQELFYDSYFLEKLDANPYLTCFENGVVDFKQGVFRRATPEDHLSKCTKICYIPKSEQDPGIVEEIRDFMRKLFPDKEIHDYMWEHLAASMIGVLPNQTWNIYIGDGQNGKSMLIKAMEYVLGEYKGTLAINLLTDRRGKVGGAMPEVLSLKGLRLAVAQEPQKGDRINDGVVKQLTSGIDTIQARGLYMAQAEEFYPQFEMVLLTNYLMEIQSNDHGTWRRIRVVPFKSLFTDEPVDGDPEKPYQFKIDRSLEGRLSSWKEVLASMLVEIALVAMGKVSDCPMVMAASNEYRQSQDCIAEFIADKVIEDASGYIMKTELVSEFKTWYETTYGRRGVPDIKEVQKYMDKKFKKSQGGKKGWMGARIDYNGDLSAQIEDDSIPNVSDL